MRHETLQFVTDHEDSIVNSKKQGDYPQAIKLYIFICERRQRKIRVFV